MGVFVISYFLRYFWTFYVFLDLSRKSNRLLHFEIIYSFHHLKLSETTPSTICLGGISIRGLLVEKLMFSWQLPFMDIQRWKVHGTVALKWHLITELESEWYFLGHFWYCKEPYGSWRVLAGDLYMNACLDASFEVSGLWGDTFGPGWIPSLRSGWTRYHARLYKPSSPTVWDPLLHL